MILTLMGFTSALQAQQPADSSLSSLEIKAYKKDARQLVDFYTFMLNMLGDPNNPSNHKQTIIEESYLKIFGSPEVQIEDDLIVGRSTMTNKDVQAYLKDVDFFFKSVNFEHEVIDVQMANRGESGIFFLLECQRLLQGVYNNGDSVLSQDRRFFEINLNPQTQNIKIASIYTSREALRPELSTWWNQLPLAWKDHLAPRIFLNDSVSLADLRDESGLYPDIGDTLRVEERSSIFVDDSLTLELLFFKGLEGEIGDTLFLIDTQFVYINTLRLKADLEHLLSLKKLDLSQLLISDLYPIEMFSALEELDLSQTAVENLFPLRQLKHLRKLDLSQTGVKETEALKYLSHLDSLDLSQTSISEIGSLQRLKGLKWLSLEAAPLTNLKGLEKLTLLQYLSLKACPISDINPLSALQDLEILILDASGVSDLSPLKEIKSLDELRVANCPVSSLAPLKELHQLTYVDASNTRIRDVSPLSNLLSLEEIDINESQVSPAHVKAFQAKNDYVTIYYQSAKLVAWWVALPAEIKFALDKELSAQEPEPRDLHRLIKKRNLVLEGLSALSDLEFLEPFRFLQQLSLSHSPLESLKGLESHPDLENLNLDACKLSSIKEVGNLKELKWLKVSYNPIFDLSPIGNLQNLEQIYLNATKVESLSPLSGLQHLSLIEADQSGLPTDSVWVLLDQKPGLNIVFRSEFLQEWWKGLGSPWQKAFQTRMEGSPEDNLVLHRFTSRKNLEFATQWRLTSLEMLSPMFALEELDVEGMGIRNLQGIQNLKHLEVVRLARNPIEDISLLTKLNKLSYLDISNTAIESLDPLRYNPKLKGLVCAGNQISSLSPLEKLYDLEHLDCSSTDVKKLDPIMDLLKLKTLNCSNTRVSQRRVAKFKEKHPLCEVIYY